MAQGKAKLLDFVQIYKTESNAFKPHPCLPMCVSRFENNMKIVKNVNPLLIAFLHGWQRLLGKQSHSGTIASKKWIKYQAPCGRLLRNTGEVEKYLGMTNSKLTIDQFSFDHRVMTSREFEANATFLKLDDFTAGNEGVPIPVVNCIDDTQPDVLEYKPNRVPLVGVPLDITQKDMVGCDCTDGCRDRTKCACWRKTFEATEFIPQKDQKDNGNNVGYRGRRLPDIVRTGIFECNTKCGCDSRCSNRVVQNGISVRLQLFKTQKKGWGLRCLDDIAKGTFICIYAGHLMTEEQSDKRGIELGDEYFAELDFVECLKKFPIYDQLKENEDFDSDNCEEEDMKEKKNNLNGSMYQRPKSHAVKPKINTSEDHQDIQCIILDSDEDEQDIENIKQIESNNGFSRNNGCVQIKQEAQTVRNNYNENRRLNYEEKIRVMTGAIDSNRFFTDPNNKFYYKKFMQEKSVYIMDAKITGNIGRYFNHSCTPNLFVQNVFVDTYDLQFPWIAFFSSENIIAGTELCWDYNYTIGSVTGRELYCYCKTRNCRGRLL